MLTSFSNIAEKEAIITATIIMNTFIRQMAVKKQTMHKTDRQINEGDTK